MDGMASGHLLWGKSDAVELGAVETGEDIAIPGGDEGNGGALVEEQAVSSILISRSLGREKITGDSIDLESPLPAEPLLPSFLYMKLTTYGVFVAMRQIPHWYSDIEKGTVVE